MGRFCIWTESAFRKLDPLYGTWKKASEKKANYNLPMPKMTVPDIQKLIRSSEITSQLKPIRLDANKRKVLKKNPLKNPKVMFKLNPYSVVLKRAAKMSQIRAQERRDAIKDGNRGLVTKKSAGGK
ncbi:hypothetical protein, partial [Salmonella sp. s51944]|uniref:hypothetical protein n=1 Tax=Salmonella sp. s51944 TaxID=3159655 RepID=UPI00397EFAAA